MNRSNLRERNTLTVVIGLLIMGFGLLGFALVMFGHKDSLQEFFSFAALGITGFFALMRTDNGVHPTGEPSDPVSTRDAPQADPAPTDADPAQEGEPNGNQSTNPTATE